ncbi:MAG TPA: tetratricopeptide repeat protein [Burkholderiales bacterium]|jgi:TPR repeat protein
MHRCALLLLLLWSGVARAGYEAGWEAYQRGDYARAFAELVPAADGDARAALALAQIYERGEAAPRDAHQALLWRRRAAELGDRQAQVDLADRYLAGRGAPADPREALVWYARAAQQGDAEAQFALGRLLSEGRGIAPDAAAGRQWIERAAANGSAQARQWLGWPPPAQTAAPQIPAPTARARPRADAPDRAAQQDSGDPRVRPAPDISWHWGMHYGVGPPDPGYRGGWYPWGWYSFGWYPYGWYPYGYPHSGVTFGFTFGN